MPSIDKAKMSSPAHEADNVSTINWANIEKAIQKATGRGNVAIDDDVVSDADKAIRGNGGSARVKVGNINGNRFCIRIKDGKDKKTLGINWNKAKHLYTGILFGGILRISGSTSNWTS